LIAATAGHTSNPGDARPALLSPDPATRATALGALARCGALTDEDLSAALADPAPHTRARALRLLGGHWRPGFADAVLRALDDDNDMVAEVAAFCAGESDPTDDARDAVVERLARVATSHSDALVREAAVAALGSIGAAGGRAAVLAACSDLAAVRRRAVLALVAFDGDEVDAELERLTHDRDWQVRQAAEELLAIGGPIPSGPGADEHG
jgi:HEAT repeat protein